MCVIEHVLELANATNNLALLLAGSVVATILLEVTLGTSSFNLFDDI